ncbi:MBL fold metallo-hydrolase [Marichromatium gracile]|uniref:MBL fold metallo-hydrolase n=1 Tax=Marichromatium gracile TaxID=1048 RepID=UPI001F310CD6|nr:MBL fold metallo-hydrolase [Marichromatium gracile]MCF1182123.1 MBL fold metallo-hydrolase [Marichromatium gracile]
MHYQIQPVTPFQQNCTLVWCDQTRRAAVIDPGGEPEVIATLIEQLELIPQYLLLTHGHLDHVGASAPLAARLGVPILGPHRDDAFLIKTLEHQCELFGFPPVEPFTPQRWLTDGETIALGEQTLEVIHTPGHTPGHIAYLNRASGLIQLGDVLFRGSIGRTDFPRGDHAQLIASIRERLFPLGDEIAFIPGHGPMSTLGRERRTNPFVRDPA